MTSQKESAKLWYLKNKEKEKQRMKQWRLKNKEKIKQYRKQYHKENKEYINNHKKEYRKTQRAKELKKKDGKNFYAKHKTNPIFMDKKHQSGKNYYQNNREKILAKNKIHSQIPEVKARRNEMSRLRRKTNPQSNRRGSIDLQIAMNNVRKRDHNTCQWQGCGLTFRQTPIHVHHIFLRSEHPELELIEQYMICYCANHHGYWHRMRGDKFSEMIPARYQENGILSNEVKF